MNENIILILIFTDMSLTPTNKIYQTDCRH
jgi:hypothetical protein